VTDLSRRLAGEAVGSAFLVAAIVGSGIMATTLTGDPALQLLCNALATSAMLVVLITLLGPVSGAHFNPLISGVMAGRGELAWRDAALYATAQIAGGCAGTVAAHLMFGLPPVAMADIVRSGSGQWLAEAIASFGLVTLVLVATAQRQRALPALVGLYIGAAYWFTASTSFANPAVTVARALTESFAGIAPQSAPVFIAAQLLAVPAGSGLLGWLFRMPEK
jgi:glycerol uptake facilitator-like aquaporin